MIEFKEIRLLFDIWEDSSGCLEDEILGCEDRLGAKLPETLRQYYLQLGANEELNQTQDSLILPTELQIYDDGFVIIYRENQFVWQAGIKFSDFGKDNPDVYLSYDMKNWNFEIGSLFNFLTAEAYLQALFALPFNANSIDIGKAAESRIRQNWKESEVKSYLWGTEFFQNLPDEIVALMKSENQVDVFIAAPSEERFRQIDEKIGIEWDYNSLED